MRYFLWIVTIVITAALQGQGPETTERRLSNGMRVLVVERPSNGMVHVALFVRGGRSDSGGLPPAAVELLARSLFGRCMPADLSTRAEAMVREEEALCESVRRETLQRSRFGPGADPPEVTALHAQAMARLKTEFGDETSLDLMEQLGVTGRTTRTNADFITTSFDLPASQLEPWARVEAMLLKDFNIFRFPLERERWLEDLRKSDQADVGLSPLLGSAFVGQPYASAMDENPGAIACLTRTDAKALATRLFSPDRLLMVLVGDISADSILPILETNFGQLRSSSEPESIMSGSIPSMSALRLQVSRSRHSRIYLGWRIPPASSPDTLGLALTARVLGQGSSGRLQTLVDRGIARNVKAELGIPGSRALNLLIITAEPEEGHSLAELEIALRGEILRLMEELVPGDEFQKALNQLELQDLSAEEDPATLAATLGVGWAVLGDWRQAFLPTKRRQQVRPDEIQRMARLYLPMDRLIVGVVEPDQSLNEDPLDRKLAQALRALALRKGVEPAKAEILVQEGMRQLQMLPRDQRATTLRLLDPAFKDLKSKEAP
ncbi:MAG: insulinase family protein [Holophagaceae bacterium]|nr:insulinase family protein [Holophagaceae bacterium]